MSGGLFPRREPTGSWWRDHSLSLAVIAIFLAHIAYDAWTTWKIRQLEAAQLELPYWLEFTHDLNESVGAEPWGVLIVVLLTKWLYERGSDASS